jgi:ABC-type polysaccharide/polyol phosphate transport system ATPase subunit
MENKTVIKVQNVSKSFRIPHERVSSVRSVAVNMFRKKTYEEFQALDDVSFEIKQGEWAQWIW